jgi:hypothetical protein
MRRFFKLLFMPCEGHTELMSNAMETDLPSLERFAVWLHAVYCRSCGRYRKQIRQLRKMLRRIDEQSAAAGANLQLGAEARERLLAALKGNGPKTP